jgi:hypothetical protein
MRPSRFRLNTSHPLAQGLVFAGLGQHPGGGMLYDSSVYRHDGTLTNMNLASDWAIAAEIGRNSLGFDGSNDYVDAGKTLSGVIAANSNAVTISSWINLANITSNSDIIGERDTSYSPGFLFQFVGATAGDPLKFVVFGGFDQSSDASGIGANEWRHIACTYQPGSLVFFVDGNVLSTHSVSGNIGATDVTSYIGATNNRGSAVNEFPGKLADVCIFSRVLSVSEIRSLADPSNILLDGLIQPDATRTTVFGWTAPEEEEPEETPRVTTLSRSSIRPPRFSLNTSHPLAQGLVFAGLGQNPGGDRMYDSSIYDINTSFENLDGTDWLISNIGRFKLSFLNDVNDIVVIENQSLLDFTSGPFTFTAWIKHSGQSRNYKTILAKRNVENGYQYHFRLHEDKLSLLRTGGSTDSTTVLDSHVWYHGAVVIESDGTGTFYLDGNIDGTLSNQSMSHIDVYPRIGNYYEGDYGLSYGGSLADICIWNRALSQIEIKLLANSGDVLLDGLIQPYTPFYYTLSQETLTKIFKIGKLLLAG